MRHLAKATSPGTQGPLRRSPPLVAPAPHMGIERARGPARGDARRRRPGTRRNHDRGGYP